MNTVVKKSKLHGDAPVPGSKSHTIRAVLLGLMSKGASVIHNPLPSLDCKSALSVARCFGAEVDDRPGLWTVKGVGSELKVPDDYVDCGNSGSTAYFSASIAALVDGYTFLTGDGQIRRRPIQPVLDAINQLGGTAFTSRPGVNACPAIIRGRMKGGEVRFNHCLSQFVSSVMMAAPLLENDTVIINTDPLEKPYLQMSIDWMSKYGVELKENSGDYTRFVIPGGREYTATESHISSDWSSVAFPLVAGIVTDSEITISGVNFEDSQGDKAVVDHLIMMGADIVKDPANGRIIVKGGKALHSGMRIDLSDIPDSLPALSVAAAFAEGDTTFTGLGHVRMKETDRVAVMASELTKVGASVEVGSDYMIVHGGKKLTGATVSSFGDHRVAMAMIVCGMFAEGEMTVTGSECAAVSFPTFFEVMEGLGADMVSA